MSAVEAEFLKAQQARLDLLADKKTARRRDMEQEQEQHQQHEQVQGTASFGTVSSANDKKNVDKPKFRFKRYHQAMAARRQQEEEQQQQQPQQQPTHPGVGENTGIGLDVAEEDGDKKDINDDLMLHGHENAMIHIWDNRVEILSTATSPTTTNNAAAATTTARSNSSSSPTTKPSTILPSLLFHAHPPTVLRNLRHCHVYYHLERTASTPAAPALDDAAPCSSSSSSSSCWAVATLHFVDLQHSTITFLISMDSKGDSGTSSSINNPGNENWNDMASIHVTNCHACTFSSSSEHSKNGNHNHTKSEASSSSTRVQRRRLSCQQVRLHESSQLDIYLDVTAGAILEDCTGITFYRRPHQDDDHDDHPYPFLSVQDFGWLRSGIPSPNYQILVAASVSPPPLLEEETLAITMTTTTTVQGQHQSDEHVDHAEKDANDDDDDDDRDPESDDEL